MNYFSPNEFNGWFERMNQNQIDCLNKFRELWGAAVIVSPVEGAVGRHGGGSKSLHNIDRYGEVKATDVFPSGLTSTNLQRAYDCAKKAGFTGIGVYTEARPSIMLHLDTREGSLAKWSAWRKANKKGWRYAGIIEAGIK